MTAVDSSIHLFKERPLTSLNIKDRRDDQYERNFEIDSGFINPPAVHSCHLCVRLLRFSVKAKENYIRGLTLLHKFGSEGLLSVLHLLVSGQRVQRQLSRLVLIDAVQL